MTPGTLVCRASSMVTAPERAMSAAVTVVTAPGTLLTTISLPANGDILTKPPARSPGIAMIGASGGGARGAAFASGSAVFMPASMRFAFRVLTRMRGKASGFSAGLAQRSGRGGKTG